MINVFPEPAVSHTFLVPALTKNVLSIFFSCWLLVNDSRDKRVSAFLLCFIGFKIIFIYFLWKWVVSDETYSFKDKELLIILKNADTLLYDSVSLTSWGTWQPMIFTYFASTSPLKFYWYSSFNLARSMFSFYWCYIFSFGY